MVKRVSLNLEHGQCMFVGSRPSLQKLQSVPEINNQAANQPKAKTFVANLNAQYGLETNRSMISRLNAAYWLFVLFTLFVIFASM